jgi:hypothetical protein
VKQTPAQIRMANGVLIEVFRFMSLGLLRILTGLVLIQHYGSRIAIERRLGELFLSRSHSVCQG